MRNHSRTEYSILNILTGVGGYFLNTLLGFICRMVFVRCLAAEYLGVNGLFVNILSMLSLAELGVGSAIVYALYKPLAENDEEKIASLVQMYGKAYRVIGGLIMVIGLALMPFLELIIQQQPNISESLYLLYFINLFNTASSYFFSYRSSLLIAAQRNYIVSGINYAVTILQSILQMVFLLLFQDYLGYLLIQTVGTFIYNVLVSWVSTKYFPFIRNKKAMPLPEEERRALFSNIRDLMVYKVSGLLVNSTDNILITFFNGLATTGIASNYTLLVNTLNSLLGQIFNGLTASVGNHNASESVEKRYEMFSFLNMMNFWIFGWAALGIFYCSSDLVQLCFGAEYMLPVEIPFVMALNFFSVGMMNAIWTYKHTMGLFHYGRFIQIFTGLLNIVFSVVLGTCWGLFGILFATFAARALTSLWYDPYAVFTHGFAKSPMLYLKKIIKYTTALLIAAILCQLMFAVLRVGLLVRALLKIVFCSVIANGVFAAVFCRTKEFAMMKQYIVRIWDKLFRHK
jgi:O-antigen/teichoic acid export membrane protein